MPTKIISRDGNGGFNVNKWVAIAGGVVVIVSFLFGNIIQPLVIRGNDVNRLNVTVKIALFRIHYVLSSGTLAGALGLQYTAHPVCPNVFSSRLAVPRVLDESCSPSFSPCSVVTVRFTVRFNRWRDETPQRLPATS